MSTGNVKSEKTLGIIAGGGLLPEMIRDECLRLKRPFFILALEGQADPSLYQSHAHQIVRLGAVGTAISYLKKAKIQELVFAGTVRRPGWTQLRPDKIAIKWLFRMGKSALGDDGLLTGVIRGFEAEGMHVLSVQDVLPRALVVAGALGRMQPAEKDQQDIARGILIAKTLGALDVGQAVIVEQGLAIGVEGIEGTAQLLERCQPLRREKKAGVLIKACKPQQEHRVDLPSIGPDTIDQVAECGLNGIAVEAGASLILDLEATIQRADAKGVFIFGFKASDYDS